MKLDTDETRGALWLSATGGFDHVAYDLVTGQTAVTMRGKTVHLDENELDALLHALTVVQSESDAYRRTQLEDGPIQRDLVW